jgi:hypothetical protein
LVQAPQGGNLVLAFSSLLASDFLPLLFLMSLPLLPADARVRQVSRAAAVRMLEYFLWLIFILGLNKISVKRKKSFNYNLTLILLSRQYADSFNNNNIFHVEIDVD